LLVKSSYLHNRQKMTFLALFEQNSLKNNQNIPFSINLNNITHNQDPVMEQEPSPGGL
jgi:hypothetical protein